MKHRAQVCKLWVYRQDNNGTRFLSADQDMQSCKVFIFFVHLCFQRIIYESYRMSIAEKCINNACFEMKDKRIPHLSSRSFKFLT